MAFSWSTLGKETTLVRGIPSQFDAVYASFAQIESLTRCLSDDLHEIRMGQCEGFAGEAANSFHSVIGKIYTSLSDVPLVAQNISIIFRDHSTSLTELRKEAESALARAKTRWNDKCQAENDINHCRGQLRSLSSQISALEGSCDPMADDTRGRLLSYHTDLGGQLSSAQRRLKIANNRLDDSRREYDRIRSNEDELNEATKNRIDNLALWSLTDTGNFITEGVANFFAGLADALDGIWDYLVENVLQQLYDILDLFLDAIGFIDLVLGFIPIVGQAIMLIEATLVTMKTLAGLALVVAGKMQLNQFLLATAIDLAGVIPGVPRFVVKTMAKTATKATGILIKAGSKGAKRTLDVAGDVADAALGVAGKSAKHTFKVAGVAAKESSKVLAKGVRGLADSTGWVSRRVSISWEKRFRNLGDILERDIRRVGDVVQKVADRTGKVIDEVLDVVGDGIDEVLDVVGDVIDDIGSDLGDFLTDNADELMDKIPNKEWDKLVNEVRRNIEERALGDSSEPARQYKYPVLEPCKLTSQMAVAA